MKIRNGFISNSSSSSFILKQKYLEKAKERLNAMIEELEDLSCYEEGTEVYLDDHIPAENDLTELLQDIITWDFQESENWIGRTS